MDCRILGLDYGTMTVGVAISDPLMITAQGLEIIRRDRPSKLRATYQRIEQLIEEYGVNKVVIGLPKHMNGDEGIRVEETKEFGESIKRRTGVEVEYWDERLTTVAADKAMMETGIRRENRKDYVDEIAAMLILQGYLERMRNAH